MKKAALIERIKSSFGHPVVDVYMTDPMIETQIDIAFDRFSANVYKKEILTLPAVQCQELNPQEIVLVIDVQPDNPNAHRITTVYHSDEFTLAETQQFFDTRNGGLEGPILAQMVRNQLDRTFDNKFDWAYDRETGKLYVDNVPDALTNLSATVKKYYALENMPKYAEDWFFAYCLALCKIVEGKIRSKFKDSIPGAPSDGDTLVQEGTTERDNLNNSLTDLISYDMGVRW